MNIHNQVIHGNTGIIIKGKHITITKQSYYYMFDRKTFCHILFYTEKRVLCKSVKFWRTTKEDSFLWRVWLPVNPINSVSFVDIEITPIFKCNEENNI